MTISYSGLLAAVTAVLLSACGGASTPSPESTNLAQHARRAEQAPVATDYYNVLQKIYVGYFGRPADPGGLAFYAGNYLAAGSPTDIVGISLAYDSNLAVKALIDSFGTSEESAALYPGDNRAFVTAIYRNLFNRLPDQGGLDFWAHAIEVGAMTRANAAISIMAGAQSTDADGVTRKQEVASAFTAALASPDASAAYSGLEANEQVRAMLQQVSYTTDVAAFQLTIASTIAALESSPPAKAPLRSGGTVHALISTVTNSGFTLLSSAPAAPTWRPAPHAGAVWDNARKTLWVFGSETHNTDMDNAVYGWRAGDGKFIKQYDADDKAGYRMDSAGIYWSSAAKLRPWAMHTYRRLRWVAAANEIEVVYDPNDHASLTPIFEDAQQTVANRVAPTWYYNVVTGNWRHATVGQSAQFSSAAFIFPVGWDATYGWFTDDGATWRRLSPAGVITTTSILNKVNSQYHSYMFVRGNTGYKVGGNANIILYSKHPLDNLASSQKFLTADYPALAGFSITNMASAMMPDGRIAIFPTKDSATHAMVLDPVANTVTDSGHSFSGMDRATNYELGADWSDAHNAVILLSRRFATNRVYAWRP